MKQQCIEAVEAAIGRKLKVGESQDIEAKIVKAKKNLARQDREKWLGLSESERTTQAATIVGMDALAEVKRKNMILAQDIITQHRNRGGLDHSTLASSEVIDRMIAPHGDMSGITSIDSHARAIAEEANGILVDFYSNIKGGTGVFTDKQLVHNIIKERFKEDSGDPLAKKIADKMEEVFDILLRERFNRSGGDIGKLDVFGLPTHWDSRSIKDAGFDQWLSDALKNIDRSKLLHEDGRLLNENEIVSFLTKSFETLESGGANKIEPGRNSYGGGSKVTNRRSESRVLHWKNADAWMEMQGKYGAMPFVDLVENHVSGISKDIALVEKLGSNPEHAMKLLQEYARKLDHENGVDERKTDRALQRADVMFESLMGKNSTPEYEVLNNLGIVYRAYNVATMLGSSVLSQFSDLAAMAKIANIHGLSQRKMFGEMLSQLNPRNAEHRKEAASLGVGVNEMIGSLARWGDDGLTSAQSKSSKLARASTALATQVMRLALVNAWTAASKRGFTKMMMNNYANLTRDKGWSDLHPTDREIMTKTGLDERVWEVMSLAEPVVDKKGNLLMSAYSIRNIPDADFLTAIDKDVKALVDDIDSQVHDLNSRNQIDDDRIAAKAQRTDDLKQQLSQRLQDYANRKDTKSQAEKQALQDRIDLLDAQKESAAALADMNAYMRTVENQDSLKDFMDNITQGKEIDRIAARSEKLGKELQKIDNRVSQETARLSKMINGFEKEIQAKFKDFDELLSNKKIDAEKLAEYEAKLAERLNTYSTRRDIKSRNEVNALEKLKELSAAKQEQLKKSVEIDRAVAQTKMKNKTDAKIDSSIERNARKDYRSGESIGQRIGSAERRIVELRAKMRNADSEANKAITKKFNDLDKRVRAADDEYAAYATKVNERQEKRSQVADRLNKSIDAEKLELVKRKKDEMATRFQAHLLDEQGMAIVEAGLRERTRMLGRTTGGDTLGFLARGILQFKSFPVAFLMRHGSRMNAQESIQGKAGYGIPLFVGMTALGGLALQLGELALGNDPLTIWDSDDHNKTLSFWGKSALKGGGLSILGDIFAAGADPSGRDIADFIGGPMGGDVKSVANITVGNLMQWHEGKDTNVANEAFRLAKRKIPGQNILYTKAALNRMIFDEIQDGIAPGYREKLLRKAELEQGRTQWWHDDLDDVEMPNFERMVK